MSGLPAKPSSCSTAISTGRPWQSQPARRGHVPALHGLEPGEDVLERAGLDVVGARAAVGRRRALVEDPLRLAGGLLEAPGEDLVGLPPLQDLLLEGGQVDLRGQGGEGPAGRALTASILPDRQTAAARAVRRRRAAYPRYGRLRRMGRGGR